MEEHALCDDNHRYQSTRLQEKANVRYLGFALVDMMGAAVGGLNWLHCKQMWISLSCQNPKTGSFNLQQHGLMLVCVLLVS